jgi:hypothetical protein
MGVVSRERVRDALNTQEADHQNGLPWQQIGHYLLDNRMDVRNAVAEVQKHGVNCGRREADEPAMVEIREAAQAEIRADKRRGRPRRVYYSHRYIGTVAISVITLIPVVTLLVVAFLASRWSLLLTRPETTLGAAWALAWTFTVLLAETLAAIGDDMPYDCQQLYIGGILAIFLTILFSLLPIRDVLIGGPVPDGDPVTYVLGSTGWVFLAGTVIFGVRCLFGKFADRPGRSNLAYL